jgi:hypothetical protein
VTYKADGLGQEVKGTASGGQFVAITPSGVADGYSAYLTFDSALELSRLALTTPPPTQVALDKTPPDTTIADVTLSPGTSPQFVSARNPSDVPTSVAIMAKPIDLGWEYQTFGVWETVSTDGKTFGAMSVGSPTVGTDIPITGNPTFTGYTTGSYVNVDGKGTTVFAALTVGADFGARSLTFNTSNTQTSSNWVDDFIANPGLNLNGTLTYAENTNRFTGSVTSASGLTGNSTGQFYGPNAEELGGVFLLQGIGVETYAGAYGAKQ